MPEKHYLGMTVFEAARLRIAWVFDTFPRIYLSFSGGKDSTVMLHLVMDEAIRRNRKIGILFVDLEAQYNLTIEFIERMRLLYADHIEFFWSALPLALDNSPSMHEPMWCCWHPAKKDIWVREPPEHAITLANREQLPFYSYYSPAMEFEDFVPEFGDWYSEGKLCACFVGIRAAESLNRWRTIAGHGTKFEDKKYVQHVGRTLWNVYPIYDWKTEDDWTYLGKFNKSYNPLYDRMHQAGLTPHQMRICQPYGHDQMKGLWLYHVIEPDTWQKVIGRVAGVNQGALYANERGNILGNAKITKPDGHTWESYTHFLLATMPPQTADHYKDKFAVYLKWWYDRDYPDSIPDEQPGDLGTEDKSPSWRRLCKVLLRGDYYCKALSFNAPKGGSANQKYKELMAKRRNQWNIFPTH